MRTGANLASLIVVTAGAVLAADSGVAALGQGINAYSSRDFNHAIAHLGNAAGVSKLADYIAYYRGYSQLLTGNIDGAVATLAAYRANPIEASPLAGKISVVYGRALLDKHQPDSTTLALQILQKDYKFLPQPDGDFAQGLAYEAQGEQQQAALAYQ